MHLTVVPLCRLEEANQIECDTYDRATCYSFLESCALIRKLSRCPLRSLKAALNAFSMGSRCQDVWQKPYTGNHSLSRWIIIILIIGGSVKGTRDMMGLSSYALIGKNTIIVFRTTWCCLHLIIRFIWWSCYDKYARCILRSLLAFFKKGRIIASIIFSVEEPAMSGANP